MFATSISEPEAPDAADIRSWHVTPIPGLDDLYEEARMYEVVEYLQGGRLPKDIPETANRPTWKQRFDPVLCRLGQKIGNSGRNRGQWRKYKSVA